MQAFWSRHRESVLFILKLAALLIFYFFWFVPRAWHLPVISTFYGHFVHYTLLTLIESSVWLLNLLGYGAEVVQHREIDLYGTVFNIHIKNYCLGLDMMFVFTSLILAFPGRWKDRLWFIPLGLVGIHIINIFRTVGLCLSWLIIQRGDFVDHHDVFNVLSVIFIFLMFTRWVKRYRATAQQKRRPA